MSPGKTEQGRGRRKRPRTCVGCRKEEGKRGLLRIVRSPEGNVHVDRGGKAPGRGAYLCRDLECLKAARRRDALSRALRVKVPEQIYDEMEEACGEKPGTNEKGNGEAGS